MNSIHTAFPPVALMLCGFGFVLGDDAPPADAARPLNVAGPKLAEAARVGLWNYLLPNWKIVEHAAGSVTGVGARQLERQAATALLPLKEVTREIIVRRQIEQMSIDVKQAPDGTFTGTITDRSQTPEVVTEVRAANLAELQQQSPQFQGEWISQPMDSTMFDPAGKPTAFSAYDEDGDCRVSASFMGRSIDIRRDRQQRIRITLRRYWDDLTRIEIYQAPNLFALQSISAESGKLFFELWKLGEFDKQSIKIRIPLRIDRTVDGKHYVIRREGLADRSRIWVKVTERINGKSQLVEEFYSECLSQLRRSRPEIAQVYDKACEVKTEPQPKHRLKLGLHFQFKAEDHKPFLPESELETIRSPTPRPKLTGAVCN